MQAIQLIAVTLLHTDTAIYSLGLEWRERDQINGELEARAH